jgi:phage virion morphogenesis protein
MDIRLQYDDAAVIGLLKRLVKVASDATPVMAEIADRMVSATQDRFRAGKGPDGTPWKPSRRVQEALGGKALTLVDSGHLMGSLSRRATRDSAEWGVNRVYAAIHQFGGVIRPKKGKALKFSVPVRGGKPRFFMLKSVTIPARPYLGVNDDDQATIVKTLTQRIEEAIHAR